MPPRAADMFAISLSCHAIHAGFIDAPAFIRRCRLRRLPLRLMLTEAADTPPLLVMPYSQPLRFRY